MKMRPNIVTTDNVMPAGEYYVGDLCYVMHNYWDEVCDLIIDGHNVKDGVFTLSDGTRFAIVSTHYGDGVFYDEEGRDYPVDSGSIGCVLWSVARKDGVCDDIRELGNRIEFESPFVVGGDQQGTITFGDVAIYTGFADDDDEDPDYSDEE
jgi:hypothetical protein